MTVAQLMRTMTEAEFQGWQAYAARRLLPTRRQELYLAQIATVVARVNGNDQTMSDFLIQPAEDEPASEEDLKRELGFSPVNRRH